MPFLPVDHQANGAIAANAQTVILDVTRHAIATVTLTGTWVGTVQFEVTTDNVTWVGIPVTPVAGGATVTSATANGTWSVYVSAYAAVRLRASAWTSGSVAVAIRASAAGGSLTALTAGSIVFANASGVLAQDNSNLFYDSVNHRLGVGIATPSAVLHTKSIVGTTPPFQANHTVLNPNPGFFVPFDHVLTYRTDDLGGHGVTSLGIRSYTAYGLQGGTPVAAKGTVHGVTSWLDVLNNGDAADEMACYVGFLSYQNNDNAFGGLTPGRGWLMDLNLHGAIATQQSALGGVHAFINNHFNGSPSVSKSGAFWAVTGFANGGGSTAFQAAAQTYPIDVGIGIVGTSGTANPGTTAGRTVGMQIGGAGSNWNVSASRIGTGVTIQDHDTAGITIGAPYTGTTPLAFTVAATGGGMVLGATSALRASELEIIAPTSKSGMDVRGSGGNVAVFRRSSDAGSVAWFADNALVLNLASILWNTDSTQDIGTSGANRARDLFLGRNAVVGGSLASGQSATAPDPTTGGTIATANIGVARVAPAGAETGMILAVGTTAGQEVTVINEAVAANSITFAAQATSHVSNGVSTVIAGLTAKRFVWDTGTSLWYPA